MFLRGQYHSWHHFPSTLGWSDAMSSQQICRWPQTGEEELSRCWRILLFIGTSRSWKNGLPGTAQGESCIWKGTISGQVSRQLNAHWIAALRAQSASSLLSCITWDTMNSFGMPSTREMLIKWNELTWPGAGVHNGCGKAKKTGRGGSGAAQCPENRGLTQKAG